MPDCRDAVVGRPAATGNQALQKRRESGDWAAAETWFNEAIVRNPAYVEARHNLAASQLKRAAWHQAVDTLGSLLLAAV